MGQDRASNEDVLRARIGAALGKYHPLGGWLQKQPDDLQPALEGEVSADVVVVGAGFAGLSTALELSARGAKVVVLERDFAGFGASGRNAGFLAGGQALEYDLFLKRVGREQARKIVDFYQEGVAYVERKLVEHGIDCDYRRTGLIRAAIHASQERKLRKTLQTGIELGAPATFLDSSQMRARGIPPAFLFGFSMSNGGLLDPGKYVMGLRRAAIRAGVKLYESTPMLGFAEGQSVTCRTGRGRAEAPFVVLATNAYTPQLGLLRDRIMPLRVSAIETEPLTVTQRASLGWPGCEGIVTEHLVMESYGLTARNTLVLTTKRLGYECGSRTPHMPDESAYRALVVALHERFPTLRNLAIQSCWSGYISFAYDALPVVGATGARQNILYAAGCSGHGVGTQSLMGRLLAERISGAESPLLDALHHRTPSTLPEPLQWCVMNSVLGAAHLLDDHANRKARKAAARGG